MFIDTHTHFDMLIRRKQGTEKELVERLEENRVSRAVQVSIDSRGLEWSMEFYKRHKSRGIFYTLGIHPSSPAWDTNLELLDKMVEKGTKEEKEGLLGIGECGLDYYRMHQEKEMQQSSFRHQIFLSKKYNLPLIIHTRDALEDTREILEEMAPVWGIMHCFPGDKKEAKKFLDLGFYISFAGNVTYKNAPDLHSAAAYVPSDRILAETDAPFLTPVPFRGKKNRPEYVKHTYNFLADLRGVEPEKLEDQIENNFMEILKRRY